MRSYSATSFEQEFVELSEGFFENLSEDLGLIDLISVIHS